MRQAITRPLQKWLKKSVSQPLEAMYGRIDDRVLDEIPPVRENFEQSPAHPTCGSPSDRPR